MYEIEKLISWLLNMIMTLKIKKIDVSFFVKLFECGTMKSIKSASPLI